MSKRHVKELEQVYACILKDAAYAYPSLGEEFARDSQRLQSMVSARGIHTFVVDLPAAGKHFDRCLSDGEYKTSGLPLTKRVSGRVAIPKLFRGLYLLIFDHDGFLREDPDVLAIFFLRQLYYCAKKVEMPCKQGRVEDEVLDFYQIDCELPEPSEFWSSPSPTFEEAALACESFSYSFKDGLAEMEPEQRLQLSDLLATLDQVSNIVTSTLGCYNPSEWRFRHGPGAISEVVGPTDKYSWRNWSERLENAYPIADYGFHNHNSWASRCGEDCDVSSLEPASRLIAVRKSYLKPRLIAAEPSEHQFCQQNLWHYFRVRTQSSWLSMFIAFGDQTLNQSLCRRGSLCNDLSTVDLSAASDRVTCKAVESMFRINPKLVLSLQATRTRFLRQTLTTRVPKEIALKKFSTMGSACTFPVESLLFLSIALSATLRSQNLVPTPQNIRSLAGTVAVFGDDIVVPKSARVLLEGSLKLLHFKINDAKSFWEGNFRESCGVETFRGVEVTPIYWKRPFDGKPASLVSVAETCNNFYNKFLLNVSSYLASTIGGRLPVISARAGAVGLVSRTRNGAPYPLRINVKLQRLEARVPALTSQCERVPTNSDSSLHQYFTEAPSPFDEWKAGVAMRPRLKIRPRWVPLDSLLVPGDL